MDFPEMQAMPQGEGGLVLPSALTATLFSSKGKLAVQLIDLSEREAIAVARQQPPNDSLTLLVRNGIKVPAIVMWNDGQRFGLRFEEPLADRRRHDAFKFGWGRQPAFQMPDALAA